MFKSIYDRVVRSYGSTLAGLGAGIVVIVVDILVPSLEGDSRTWAKALAAVLVLVGASLKSKALPPAP